MKTLNRVAIALAAAALATTAGAQEIHNWKNAAGEVWKNAAGECWRDGSWTPATAAPGCDGAFIPPADKPTPAAPAAPAPAAKPAPAPAAAPAPAPVVSEKVKYSADAFFDFDKSVLKPEGKTALDDLAAKLKMLNLEAVIAVGHTDSVGKDAYNQKLSEKRAAAVKAYLISKGVDKSKLFTEGKGEKQPVADNKTKEGRAKNRRVVVDVTGVRTK